MSLQGPLIVVAEQPATELVEALSTAGAFPIVESKWADAPAAFVTVKPAAIVIAEPGAPANIASARMLCLQVATVNGPIVPVIARVCGDEDAAMPIALPADATLPVERLLARLQFAFTIAFHIVFPGFQVAGTRGAKMVEGAPDVKIFGEYVAVKAQVSHLEGFSGHADADGLMHWLRGSGIAGLRGMLPVMPLSEYRPPDQGPVESGGEAQPSLAASGYPLRLIRPLLEVSEAELPQVAKQATVRDQYLYAASLATERAWQSVEQHFPPAENEQNRYYALRAKQRLAELFDGGFDRGFARLPERPFCSLMLRA